MHPILSPEKRQIHLFDVANRYQIINFMRQNPSLPDPLQKRAI
jgi:hypothetical protein